MPLSTVTSNIAVSKTVRRASVVTSSGVQTSAGVRLVPFIVTLSMLVGARGLAARMAQNRTQLVNQEAIKDLATTDVVGVPLLRLLMALE